MALSVIRKCQVAVAKLRQQRGDSLVEVTISLALLSFVLMSSTALTSTAFRTGETATERLEMSNIAQEQLEALRNFRDNNDWSTFRTGVDPVDSGFHMEIQTAGSTQWVPVAGPLTPASTGSTITLPASSQASILLSTSTPGADRQCAYDFKLTYSFETPGGSLADEATGTIETRLANLQYRPLPGLGQCPP